MTFRHLKQAYLKLLFFVFAGILPLAANSSVTGGVISEKHIKVAMRMIGHEVLLCLGDTESRIMPIEKMEERNKFDSYRIPFGVEFGFEPGEIVSIINRVMVENRIAMSYFVEVEQCETKEVVYSFEIGNAANSNLTPCGGRILPEDCYSLLVTILDDTTSDSSSINSRLLSEESNLFTSTFLIIPFLFLAGFIGYIFIKKKDNIDPNLILIGASQFDKRNMALSFENKRVGLSNKEAELLSLLHTSANAPIAREVILQRVWGDEGDYVGRTLDVFISKLRKKLEADSSVKIVNIRGVGYKLVM